MTATRVLLLGLLAGGAVTAAGQDSGHDRFDRIRESVERRFRLFEEEQRRAAEWEHRQFLRRARRFVREWNAFVEDYNRGKVDLEKVRELSKAFRKLESSSWWRRAAKPKRSRRPGRKKAAPKNPGRP